MTPVGRHALAHISNTPSKAFGNLKRKNYICSNLNTNNYRTEFRLTSQLI